MPMASTAQAGSGASQRRAPAEEAQAAREGWAQAAVATRRRMMAQRTSAGMLTTWMEAVGCCSARAAWAARARREVRRQLTPTPRATAMVGGTVATAMVGGTVAAARLLRQAAGRAARPRGHRRKSVASAPFLGGKRKERCFAKADVWHLGEGFRINARVHLRNFERCVANLDVCNARLLSAAPPRAPLHAQSALTAALKMADPKLLASLDLMRRMPPSRMERSLEGQRGPCRLRSR